MIDTIIVMQISVDPLSICWIATKEYIRTYKSVIDGMNCDHINFLHFPFL